MKQKLMLLLIIIFLSNCSEPLEKEKWLTQNYSFESVTYFEYSNVDEGGAREGFGKILFDKEKIITKISSDEGLEVDKFKIKNVFKEENENELIYKTDKGEFIVYLKSNDSIKSVDFYTKNLMVLFHKK